MDKLLSLFSTSLGLHILKIIYGVILLAASAIAAKIIQSICVFILNLLGVDKISKNIKFDDVLKRAEIKNPVSEILGNIIFWIVLIPSFIWILYYLKFANAVELLKSILLYLSINVVSGIFILTVAIVAAIFLSQIISFIGAIIFMPGYRIISKVVLYVVIIFGIVSSLDKLGVSSTLILSKMDIILGFFALAGAIAFGLGCKDLAESYLSNFLRNNK